MSVDALPNGSSNQTTAEFDLLDFLTGNINDEEHAAAEVLQADSAVGEIQAENPEDDDLKFLENLSDDEEAPSLTLSITNVVAMATMRCHLRLKDIARTSINVEYKELQNHVIMRLRRPYTVATIWSSGKIWCTGANSLVKAKMGARRIARRIAKCGFPCKFSNFRVVNIMATTKLPFRVRLDRMVPEAPRNINYEPELAPGLNFKLDPNGSTSLKLFSTGRMVCMGNSMESIQETVEALVPIAAKHQTDEPVSPNAAADDEYYYRKKKKLTKEPKKRKRKNKTQKRSSSIHSEDEGGEEDNGSSLGSFIVDDEEDNAGEGSEKGDHMRHWSSRRALKDARKNTLPQMPKEVIAAELDDDYFVDLDDQYNSDLEDDDLAGFNDQDSDAEEAALMQQRIMRGETLDDFDSSDDEQGPTAHSNRPKEDSGTGGVQLMSSEDEDEEKVESNGRNGVLLQADLKKIEDHSEAQRKRAEERKRVLQTIALHRPPPLATTSVSKIRIYQPPVRGLSGVTPSWVTAGLDNVSKRSLAGTSSQKMAKIINFSESSLTATMTTQNANKPTVLLSSGNPTILGASPVVRRLMTPGQQGSSSSILRIIRPNSTTQTIIVQPQQQQQQQQITQSRIITVNRFPGAATSANVRPLTCVIRQPNGPQILSAHSVAPMSQQHSTAQVIRPSRLVNVPQQNPSQAPMIIIRPRISKPSAT